MAREALAIARKFVVVRHALTANSTFGLARGETGGSTASGIGSDADLVGTEAIGWRQIGVRGK